MSPTTFETQAGPLPRRLLTGLLQLSLALRTESNREAAAAGLSALQIQLLGTMLSAPGEVRLDRLAKSVGVRPATASEAVRTLAAKKLLNRRSSPADGRALSLTLTAAGRRVATRVANWPDFLLESLAALPATEQASMLRALVHVVLGLQAAERIPAMKLCVTCRFFRQNAHPGSSRPHHCDFADAPFGDPHLRLECADWDRKTA